MGRAETPSPSHLCCSNLYGLYAAVERQRFQEWLQYFDDPDPLVVDIAVNVIEPDAHREVTAGGRASSKPGQPGERPLGAEAAHERMMMGPPKSPSERPGGQCPVPPDTMKEMESLLWQLDDRKVVLTEAQAEAIWTTLRRVFRNEVSDAEWRLYGPVNCDDEAVDAVCMLSTRHRAMVPPLLRDLGPLLRRPAYELVDEDVDMLGHICEALARLPLDGTRIDTVLDEFLSRPDLAIFTGRRKAVVQEIRRLKKRLQKKTSRR